MSSAQVNRYDRQIRAWGFETQRKLQETNALFIGLNHVSIECMKNLVLAGIGAVSIVTEETIENPEIQVLVSLNPNTKVSVTTEPKFDEFNLICVFNNNEYAEKVRTLGVEHVLVFGVSAYLLHMCPDVPINNEEIKTNPLCETICGALISQMIVDNIPPLEKPTALQLNFSPESLSSSVSSLLKE